MLLATDAMFNNKNSKTFHRYNWSSAPAIAEIWAGVEAKADQYFPHTFYSILINKLGNFANMKLENTF
jgi:hypothetical protein